MRNFLLQNNMLFSELSRRPQSRQLSLGCPAARPSLPSPGKQSWHSKLFHMFLGTSHVNLTLKHCFNKERIKTLKWHLATRKQTDFSIFAYTVRVLWCLIQEWLKNPYFFPLPISHNNCYYLFQAIYKFSTKWKI